MNKETRDLQQQVPWDQTTIDRLVDGELSDGEYRSLLEQFERHPEGWRACAMAFLEAQAWRAAMRDAARSKEGSASPTAPQPQKATTHLANLAPNQARQSNWSPLAVAAAIGLAFLAGRMTFEPVSTVNRPESVPLVQRSNLSNVDGNDSSLHYAHHGVLDGASAIRSQDLRSLGEMGVQVSQQLGYRQVMTQDGKVFLVPYADVKLVPANQLPY